ncbi:glycine--tRNA ligase subunit beta [Holospora curviuscula]|uniref:glycine--tRNA ligase n=1 Tax=Holospora curviuscula TaxID=1082868 RepID=A0A2S5R852_9PROT|nr:glycine--tRNA ligase subunit beta [Holospora curviuscula]PPE03362.1 Glycine--tRNA ligase beta subunit [Holospora curviuscula]
MSQALLFEVYSDEIPALMQRDACNRIKRHVENALKSYKLEGEVQGFASLRRVGFLIRCLEHDTQECFSVKGPSVEAPSSVINAFLNAHGPEICYQNKTSKGSFWFSKKETKNIEEVLHNLCVNFLEQFHWPKRMRWHETDDFSWIRPIHSLVCILDNKLLAWTFRAQGLGISTKNMTPGHPASSQELTPPWILIPHALEYEDILKEHNLWVCPFKRWTYLQSHLETLANDHGYQVFKEDLALEGLLGEVCGMTEWPKIFFASFSSDFLKLPPPFLLTTLKHHQRCFPVTRDKNLASRFIVVLDGTPLTPEIQDGHQRVAEARLSDALFFWNQDLRYPLAHYNQHLKEKIFFDGLGTVIEKVRRLEVVATHLDDSGALSAASALSKADLATQSVREFPELQGIMGKYYALAQNVDPTLAQALEEQYWPLTPGQDLTAQSCLGGWLGIIDRMDTLVGFFGIGKYPTGSKDPLALRRSAYGWVCLTLHHTYPFSISESIRISLESYRSTQRLNVLSNKDSLDLLEQLIFKQFTRYLQEKNISREISEVISVLRFSQPLGKLFTLANKLHKFLQTESGISFVSAYKRIFFLLHNNKEGLKEFSAPKHSELFEPEEKKIFDYISVPWNTEDFMATALDFSRCIHEFLDVLPVIGFSSRMGLLASVLRYTRPLGNLSNLFTTSC